MKPSDLAWSKHLKQQADKTRRLAQRQNSIDLRKELHAQAVQQARDAREFATIREHLHNRKAWAELKASRGLTTLQIAQRVGVTYETAYNWISRGAEPAEKYKDMISDAFPSLGL